MELVQVEKKALKNHFVEISDATAWEVERPELISNVRFRIQRNIKHGSQRIRLNKSKLAYMAPMSGF
jgi:hypothetical protein